MQRGGPTKLGMALIIIVVLAVVVFGIVWASRTIFGDAKPNKDIQDPALVALQNPSDKTEMRMYVRGPINARENHYSFTIAINANSRTMTTFRGYDGEVIRQEKLDNTLASYSDLSRAMARAGLATEKSSTAGDNHGICAVGQLITFEVLKDGKSIRSLWTTSCPGLVGNFGGLVENVRNLFFAQIPRADQLIRELR